jgi:acyl-CoA thioesterase
MGRWQDIMDGEVRGEGMPIPFVETLRLPRAYAWEPGRVRMRWVVREDVFHPRGAVFGGFIAALADRALGLAAISVLEDHENFTTANLDVSFFRAVTSGTLEIESRVVHRGKSLIQVEVEFTRDDGKLVAKASAAQAVLSAGGD